MMNMNKLMAEYKHLIDFNDKMQKSNYKFVEGYLSFQKRKNSCGWEVGCVEFLKGAINLQKGLLDSIKRYRALMN